MRLVVDRIRICLLIIGLLMLISGGCSTTHVPSVIVYKYDQVQPPALPPGTPPTPLSMPSIVPEKDSLRSSWDDPSIVILKNQSPFEARVEIDGGKLAYDLEPYGVSLDIPLPIGNHRVKVTIKKPTATYGDWQVIRYFPIDIRPEGRSQIFHIYDY